jgi:putative tricarboxylic transport membrane protein
MPAGTRPHGHTRPRHDWGHLALVVLIAGVVGAYLLDAVRASPATDNLILILPAAVLALGLCALIAIGVLRRTQAPGDPTPLGRAPALMALFALYILTLPASGFDVGSAVFVAAALLVDGERRPVQLVVVPLAFAVLVTLGFRALVPYPIPTLIL